MIQKKKIKQFCKDVGYSNIQKYGLAAVLMAFYTGARINWFKEESVSTVISYLNLSDMEVEYWNTIINEKRGVI